MLPSGERIYIKGKNETERIADYTIAGDKCIIVFKNNAKRFFYNRSSVKIVEGPLTKEEAPELLSYLKQIADIVGLKNEEGTENTLLKSIETIKSVFENNMLSCLLNERLPKRGNVISVDVFPFGFNLSQKEAVDKAFSNDLTIIEGPPGTGKTQTILNIIANIVMSGHTVAIVSSNNAATKNVYEKLEKNGAEFLAALLGNAQNKKEFIDAQKTVPDLKEFECSKADELELRKRCTAISKELCESLVQQNDLALAKLEMENTQTEYQHFQETRGEQLMKAVSFKKGLKANAILAFWYSIESNGSRGKRIGFFKKLGYRIKYGIKDWSFYKASITEMIFVCQSAYYPVKIAELSQKIERLNNHLHEAAFDSKMKEYTQRSMQLFKAVLAEKYNQRERQNYTSEQLYSKSQEFVKDYPVIMSTTYSLKRSLSLAVTYDYVIIDEASQVDIVTGALAFSCAKRVIVVGDTKQLPNVIDSEIQRKTDQIFDAYNLNNAFRYSNHSLLSCLIELFPKVSKTLLKEHYRCHPKIIDFCNQKFYNNQLVILSSYTNNRKPLIVYKTSPGNHARKRENTRQIEMIQEEIIPNENLHLVDLGIVTPYRKQTETLQEAFDGTSVKADTVDKFQGRENEVIIISTVDNEISEFTDNPNRLNVAVSRAREQLILLVNGNENESDGNIKDLINYIEYNSFSVVQSELRSIFDLLYKGYEEERARIIKKAGRVSRYDSENLMYALIKRVLLEEEFMKFNVVLHFPLRSVIKDFSKLSNEEIRYAQNPLTHLDFLIFNKLGKSPVLAIEVDGFEFHQQGTVQSARDQLKNAILEKYNLPMLRLSTNGSQEESKLRNALTSLLEV